ncbi:thioredoxin domain-containing protein [Notoacmeibacter sp. MSK16QG-6]|uniref:thioredoxin domain-containing protein n=1 Tax=Notoacmeibacter sp. MSK16QG-6 TaxID=2957982 RepID=UPI0020A12CB8|nr:thioredoxin domain-containing protein [Notoacmeibacter sp. MSK16QG-6]MCP1198203.1 thioredoxin domain-containing protein [Notoacmeibacter sp. MSK16QG-6]
MDFRFFRSSSLIALSAAGFLAVGVAGCSDSSDETAASTATDNEITASTAAQPAETASPESESVELAQADSAAEEKPSSDASATPDASESESTSEPAEDTAKADASDASPAAEEIERAELPEPEGTVDMEKLLQNTSLPDMVLGSEDAPVTIVEYASMTCGHCRAFHEETFPKINEAFIQTGKVRFILREFPLDPRATAAFMLARCSEDKYFPVVDVLFDRQDVWARAEPENAAKSLFDTVKIAGFTEESFDACLKDQALLDNINAVRKQASEEFEVQATPTFFIDGKKYAGALTAGQMAALIDQVAAK